MSPKVSYISTTTVRPESPIESLDRVELTPWDLFSLTQRYMQVGLLFSKPEDDTTQIDRLKTSFARTLDYFAPLTGRLATETHEDKTISFYLDCNVVGAEFVHAAADVTIADVLEPNYVPEFVLSFYALNSLFNHEGRTHPLLAVQVTELVDGIFVACSMNHVMGDGGSIWHFMNSWSAISRSLEHVPRIPIFKRWSLNETDLPIRFPSFIENVLKERPPTPVLSERVFHFTPEKVADIKLRASKGHEAKRISTLQAIMGHVWVTVTRARNLDPDDLVIYGLAAGNRARLEPPLPDEYFGNSIQSLTAVAKPGELLEKGLGGAALLMNQAIRSHSVQGIHGSWEMLIKNPEMMYSSKLPPNLLATGSSPKFDIYGNDFGWGRPIAVRIVNAPKIDGAVTVHPGAVEGCLDIQIGLAPQAMKALEEDTEFTQVVIF